MDVKFSDLVGELDKQDMLEVYFMQNFEEMAKDDFVAAATALFKGNIYSADKSFKNMYKDFEKENAGEAVTYKEFVAAAMHTIDTYKAMLPLSVGLKVASSIGNVNAIFEAYYKTLDNEFTESLDPETYPLSAPTPAVVEPTGAPAPTVVEPTGTPAPTVVEPTGTPTPAVVEPTGAAPTPGETSDRDENGYLPGDSKGKATNDFRNMGF